MSDTTISVKYYNNGAPSIDKVNIEVGTAQANTIKRVLEREARTNLRRAARGGSIEEMIYHSEGATEILVMVLALQESLFYRTDTSAKAR